MIPKQIQEKLNHIAAERAKDLYARAREILTREQFSNTGELADSLKVSWIPATDHTPPRILLVYKLQGFLLGLKKMSWVKVPNLDKLKNWGEKIDFNGPVPGYRNISNLPPWKAKERILNAIAFNKRKHDTWKQKPWKGKSGIKLGDLLRELNTETLQAYAIETERILSEAIAGKPLS